MFSYVLNTFLLDNNIQNVHTFHRRNLTAHVGRAVPARLVILNIKRGSLVTQSAYICIAIFSFVVFLSDFCRGWPAIIPSDSALWPMAMHVTAINPSID